MIDKKLLESAIHIISQAVRRKYPEYGMLSDDGCGQYLNDTFYLASFSWDDETEPNFVYDGMSVYWHQGAHRIYMVDANGDGIDIVDMVINCIASLELE